MSSRPEREAPLRNDGVDTPSNSSRENGLRRYQPPRVECHGRLHHVTQMGGSLIVDTMSNLGNPP